MNHPAPTCPLAHHFPAPFRPLAALSDHTSWASKGLQNALLTVFAHRLSLDELLVQVDGASAAQTLRYRQQACAFLTQLTSETDVYAARPFAAVDANAQRLEPGDITLRLCMRLFEKCALNLFVPQLQIAFRGADDFSMNLVYIGSPPARIMAMAEQAGLHVLAAPGQR